MKSITRFLAAAIALSAATSAFASDHQDGDLVKNDPSTDLNDLYAFPNAGNVVLIMTVAPFAATNAKFSNAAYYVFHTKSYASFGGANTGSTDIICRFGSNTNITCYVGTEEVVTGDPSKETGLTSKSGKVKIFAGVRSDPFFFYATGFKAARTAVLSTLGMATPPMTYASGCPQLNAGTVTALHTALTTNSQANNDFVAANVLGITIEVDKTLLTANPDEAISVWASTNAIPK